MSLVAWSAPSHYLNQCRDIVNWTLGIKCQWNLNRNLYIFIKKSAFENVVWEMATILSRPQCVKKSVIHVCIFGMTFGGYITPCWSKTKEVTLLIDWSHSVKSFRYCCITMATWELSHFLKVSEFKHLEKSFQIEINHMFQSWLRFSDVTTTSLWWINTSIVSMKHEAVDLKF